MGMFRTAILALFGSVYGAVASSKAWGKRLLEQELRGHNFDPSQVPDACLQELADECLALSSGAARLLGEKRSLSDQVGSIEYLAGEVVRWLGAPLDDPFAEIQRKIWMKNEQGYVRDILTRHGLTPRL
jgi:hypothetical protein